MIRILVQSHEQRTYDAKGNRRVQTHLLFKVEDVFAIKGRGLVLVPDVPVDALTQPHPHTVTLKYADGTSRNVVAIFILPMIDPAPRRPVGYLCELKEVDKADVPIGTEIWIEA